MGQPLYSTAVENTHENIYEPEKAPSKNPKSNHALTNPQDFARVKSSENIHES